MANRDNSQGEAGPSASRDDESDYSLDVNTMTVRRRRGSVINLVDFLRTTEPSAPLHSGPSQASMNVSTAGTTTTSSMSFSLSNLRQKLRNMFPQLRANPLKREISLSPETLHAIKARFNQEFKRISDKSTQNPSSSKADPSPERGRSKEKTAKYQIRHTSHERTKHHRDPHAQPRSMSSDVVVGLGINDFDVFRPEDFASPRPAPSPPISSHSSHSSATVRPTGTYQRSNPGSVSSTATVRPPPIPLRSPQRDVLRRQQAEERSPSVSSTFIRALEDFRLEEPIRSDQLQFSPALEAQFARASVSQSPFTGHDIDNDNDPISLANSPDDNSPIVEGQASSIAAGTVQAIASRFDTTTPVSRQARRAVSRLGERLRQTSERFLTPPSGSSSGGSRSGPSRPLLSSASPGVGPSNARASRMQMVRQLRGYFDYPAAPFANTGGFATKHPHHDFAWHTRNLWCFQCPPEPRCAICRNPCCVWSGVTTYIEHLTSPTITAIADPAYISSELARCRSMLARVTAAQDLGAREPYITFVRCQGDCQRWVCAPCCGKCPDPLCGLVRCRDCDATCWWDCAWHRR